MQPGTQGACTHQLAPLPPEKSSVLPTLVGVSGPRPAPQHGAEARTSGPGPLVLCPRPHLQLRRLRPGSVPRGRGAGPLLGVQGSLPSLHGPGKPCLPAGQCQEQGLGMSQVTARDSAESGLWALGFLVGRLAG